MNEPTFTPPGPGGWKRLADHFPGALTPEYQHIYAETCPEGTATYMRRYGVLAATLDLAFVQGHLYISPVPLAGPREMTRTPPAAAVWLLSRIHPRFRRRTRAARRALRDRPWREVARHWFTLEHEEWRGRCQRMQDIDPATLEGHELVAHLRSCRSLVVDGYRRHFELHGDDLLPVGLLIARCAEWGIDPGVALQSLSLLTLPFAPSAPADWMLVTGYDLDCLTWSELSNRPQVSPEGAPPSTDGRDLRPMVSEEHWNELQALIEDAQVAVPLRYHNGILTSAWPMGLLRRAMLSAGVRLELDEPSLAVELTVDELALALQGEHPSASADARTRYGERARQSALRAPPTLGPEFAIPPLGPLPRPLALIGAAQIAASDHMFGTRGAVGVGSSSHTGRALVVEDASVALSLVEPGDVIVTRATSPSWNAVLGHAGALVTTTGGLVSHAALIARELGIAAVIGDHTALDRLHTGDTVTVDPVAVLVSSSSPDVRFGPG